MRIVALVISDRASRGEYEDKGGPAIEAWLKSAIVSPFDFAIRIIPDGRDSVASALLALCSTDRADLVLAGCAILEAIRRTWPSERLRVADRGLREGILTELMYADGAWRRRRRNRGGRRP